MLATNRGPATPSRGRLRGANRRDTAEISRLIASGSPLAPSDIDAWLTRGHLLVLDRCDNTLGAVVHVDMHDGHATMDLMVIDPAEAASDVEQRVHGVVHALCEAYGYDHVDAVATARRPAGPRGRQ